MSLHIIINSLTSGGAEKVLSEISSGLDINTLFLLENEQQFTVNAENRIVLHKKLRKINKIFSLFIDPFRLKTTVGKTDLVLSFLKRSNTINIISSLITGHKAFVSEHSIPNYNYKGLKKKLYDLMLKIVYKHAKGIIVPSLGLKNYLINEIKINNCPIWVINNPINLRQIEILKREPLSPQDEEIFKSNIFISVGRLVELKNQKGIIDTFLAYKKRNHKINDKLIIFGEGPLYTELTQQINKLELNHDVLLMGFSQNIYKYISRSQAFILNSNWESFGNVIIEALACGCPVISTDCEFGPREILIKRDFHFLNFEIGEYGVLTKPNCNTSLLSAMEYLIENDEFRLKLRDKGIKRAKDFDLPSSIKKYKQILNYEENSHSF